MSRVTHLNALQALDMALREGSLQGARPFRLAHLPACGDLEGQALLVGLGHAPERGVNYALVRNALDGVRSDAGLLVCGLSCVLDALEAGSLSLPFSARDSLAAPHPYRLHVRPGADSRVQVMRFADWLAAEAARTKAAMERLMAP